MDEAPNFYADYVTFKGWDADEALGRPEDYAALLALGDNPQPERLLDLGCGLGTFLDWAKAKGIETYGTEIIPELVERGRARGHHMIDPGAPDMGGKFDAITAVDVLEHLRPDQTLELLTSVRRLLSANGYFIARFPNGQSPFSGAYQNGDLTHIACLAPNAVRQMAEQCGLRITGIHNLRPIARGLRGLKWRAAYLVRDVIETVLGLVYFGGRMPMDPNVVVVLRVQLQDPTPKEKTA